MNSIAIFYAIPQHLHIATSTLTCVRSFPSLFPYRSVFPFSFGHLLSKGLDLYLTSCNVQVCECFRQSLSLALCSSSSKLRVTSIQMFVLNTPSEVHAIILCVFERGCGVAKTPASSANIPREFTRK